MIHLIYIHIYITVPLQRGLIGYAVPRASERRETGASLSTGALNKQSGALPWLQIKSAKLATENCLKGTFSSLASTQKASAKTVQANLRRALLIWG